MDLEKWQEICKVIDSYMQDIENITNEICSLAIVQDLRDYCGQEEYRVKVIRLLQEAVAVRKDIYEYLPLLIDKLIREQRWAASQISAIIDACMLRLEKCRTKLRCLQRNIEAYAGFEKDNRWLIWGHLTHFSL
ncbi:MAG: hypothetical protein WBC05_01350 [Sedimentisphaerales bacterium]